MSRCPSSEQLEKLLEEQLGDAEHRAVSAHVGGCEQCQQSLERLTVAVEEDEGLLSSIRLPARAGSAASSSSQASGFLAQLKQASPFSRSSSAAGDAHRGSGNDGAATESPTVPGYEISKELGRGGMGVVYQARHLGLNRLVALKMILAGRHAGPKDLIRFRHEAEAVARLRHPNIIQIYDIGETDGKPFFALELVEGGSLVQQIRGEPQPILPAARLVETLARAIHYAHQHGMVHRDLKPANILLVSSGVVSGGVVSGPLTTHHSPLTVPKITDFGLARRLDEKTSGSSTAEVVGTPSYMAPEQATGKASAAAPAADIYALGAILYELLTGRPPFKGATPVDTIVQVIHEEALRPSRLRPDLPRDLETICLKCLEKEPRKRYLSADALAGDLRRFRQGKPIQARPVGPVERSWKWARRRPLTASLLAGMILSAVLGFLGVTWQWQVAAGARDAALDEKAQKEIERENADRARIEADNARKRAAKDRLRARTALYYSRIAQTQLQWRLNDLVGAERSLAKCVPGPGQIDRRNWEWHYLQGLFLSDLFTCRHQQGGLGGSVVYDPRGRWIASVVGGYSANDPDKPGEVRIWDAATGDLLHAWPAPGTMQRLAAHPGGERVALAATDGAVLIWDVDTGKELLRRTLHSQAITGIAYSPDGRYLATASWDHTAKILDAATGEVAHVLSGHQNCVHSVAFSPKGDRLATGDWDGIIRIWNAQGRLVATWDRHKSAIYCVAFSPDGQLLVSAGSNGNIKIWELETGKVVQSLTGHAGAVLSVAFSPDARSLAYSGGDSTVRVWDIENGVESIIFRGHASAVEGIHFSPDGQRIASISPARGTVKVWDLTSHPEYATFARTGLDIEAVAFHANGRDLVSVTAGGNLQTWDAVTGILQREQSLAMSERSVNPPAMLASFSPGAKRLAARSREDPRVMKAWEVATGEVAATFRGHTLPVTWVSYSGDGRLLVTCGFDPKHADRSRDVRVWDADTGEQLAALTGPGAVLSATFGSDRRWLALGCQSGEVEVVSWATGSKPYSFVGHTGPVAAIAFSPKGRVLASAGFTDRTIKIWDLSPLGSDHHSIRKALHSLPAPSFLSDLAFSPDERRLAVINPDLARLYDTDAGQEALTLRGAPQRHWDPPFNPRVLFSPDGRRLVGTNWNESFSIWDAEVQTDEHLVAQRKESRTRAADQRALFWHLQEAEVCLKHKNRPAALFHFQRVRDVTLPGPLQTRRDLLAQQLAMPARAKKH